MIEMYIQTLNASFSTNAKDSIFSCNQLLLLCCQLCQCFLILVMVFKLLLLMRLMS